MFDRYTPHIWHQIFPVLLILLGAFIAGMFPGWITIVVFLCFVFIGIITSLWIAWAGKTREEADYWWNIGQDISELSKADPDTWGALGFKTPPKSVYLRKEVTGEEDRSPIYEEVLYSFGLSPNEMSFMANELLSGKRTLAETEWVNTSIGSTRIRKVKQEMLTAGLIAKAHPSAATQGFIPTENGVVYFKKYASPWAIEMYENREKNIMKSNNTRDPHPPLEPDVP